MKTINLILIMLPCILFNCCKPHNEPIPDPPTENIENVYLVDVVDDKDYNGVIDVFYGNPFSSKVSIGTNTSVEIPRIILPVRSVDGYAIGAGDNKTGSYLAMTPEDLNIVFIVATDTYDILADVGKGERSLLKSSSYKECEMPNTLQIFNENIDLKLVKRFYKFTMDEEYFGSLIPVDDTAMAESLIMQYGGTPIKTE